MKNKQRSFAHVDMLIAIVVGMMFVNLVVQAAAFVQTAVKLQGR
jgi:hypothetical protein